MNDLSPPAPQAKNRGGGLLQIEGLHKRYGETKALDGVSLTVPPGRMVGFLGPNGAGKTTTMRAVFGLVEPEAGQVRWKGRPVEHQDRLAFGYLPEERGLYPHMRVGEQVTYFARLHGLDRSAAGEAAGRWLERLGLSDRAGDRLEQLSHGNQQKVQLAVALVHEPDLLVLDEPFSGLDPLGVETMGSVLSERAAQGVGVLFSSHQLDLVEDLCEDVVIIDRGRVVLSGPLEQVREASGHRRLEAEVVGAGDAWIRGADGIQVLDRDGDRVRLAVPPSVDLEGLLGAARSAGQVLRFSFEPPSLSELFREAVGR